MLYKERNEMIHRLLKELSLTSLKELSEFIQVPATTISYWSVKNKLDISRISEILDRKGVLIDWNKVLENTYYLINTPKDQSEKNEIIETIYNKVIERIRANI